MDRIRNFCIIAHIDHGKSTLADRLLEFTRTVDIRDMTNQLLDDMDLERERGITIKSHAIQMSHNFNSSNYILNLIDTPGHVDFSYEVSRSIGSCEGAILVVDASQGIQAQTISNLYLALDQGLEIIPVLNKIDLPGAMIEEVSDQIIELIGCEKEDILHVSAKDGVGIDNLIDRIISKVPPPKGSDSKDLQAMIFDSVYNSFKFFLTCPCCLPLLQWGETPESFFWYFQVLKSVLPEQPGRKIFDLHLSEQTAQNLLLQPRARLN